MPTYDADVGDVRDSAYLDADAAGPKGKGHHGGGHGHHGGGKRWRGRGYGGGWGGSSVVYLEPDTICLDALGRPVPCPDLREASGAAEDWHGNMAALLRRLPSFARLSGADQAKALGGVEWMAQVMGDAVRYRKDLGYTHQNLVSSLRSSPFWQQFSPDDLMALQIGIGGGFADANAQRGAEKSTLAKLGGAALSAVPYAQAVASMVPGLGSGVSAALGAASALAQGQSVTDAAIAAGRGVVPGGPLGAAAYDTAIAIARGADPSTAALEAARRSIPGGDMARKAFDTGLAMARAQAMQRAGVGGRPMTAANPLATEERRIGYRSPFASVLPSGVHTAAAALLADPRLRSAPLADVATRLHLTPSTIRAAFAAICGTISRVGSPALGGLLPRLALHPKLEESVSSSESLDAFLSRHGGHAVSSSTWNASGRGTRGRGFSRALLSHVSRHASVRALSPALRALLARTEAGALDAGGTTYTVDASDYGMAQIAKKLGVTLSALAAANPQIADINKIFRGQKLNVPGVAVAPPPVAPPPGTPPPAAPPVSGGGTYTIASGDTGQKVSQRFTSTLNRWRELPAVNPGMRVVDIPDPNDPERIMYQDLYPWRAGQVIRLPASWVAAAPPVSPPAPPVSPPPPRLVKPPSPGVPPPAPPAPPASNAALLQAQVMLHNWAVQTPGVCRPADFGASSADLTGILSARTSQAIQSFQIWWDAAGGDGSQLRTDGTLDDSTMSALQRYTSRVAPPAPPGPPILPGLPPSPPSPGGPPVPLPGKPADGGGGLLLALAAAAAAFM